MLSTPVNNNGGGVTSPVNYELIDPGEGQISIIHILEGQFRGVKFRIGKVSWEWSDDAPRLIFTTDILKKPWRLFFNDLKNNDLFTEVSGRILLDSKFEAMMNDEDWNPVRIDTRTLPHVSKDFIAQVLKECGGDEDADDFRVRIVTGKQIGRASCRERVLRLV